MTITNELVVYGTSWCGDCRRARQFLDRKRVAYRWVDINLDIEGRATVERLNRGNRSVPTLVFPDGSLLVEPSEAELTAKLGA